MYNILKKNLTMKCLIGFSLITLLIAKPIFAQENKLTERIALKGNKECKFFTTSTDPALYSEWDGKCKKGLVEGDGIIKMYTDNKSKLNIIQTTFKDGIMEGPSNRSIFFNSDLVTKSTYTYQNGFLVGLETGDFFNTDENKKGLNEIFSSYSITWESGGKKGFGNLKLNGGSKYEGEFSYGGLQPNGQGKLMYPNGDIYEGEFKLGFSEGKGKYTSKDLIYVGDFLKGSINGVGIGKYFGGWEYNGEWKDNSFNGNGTLTSDIGTLKAQFSNQKVNGKGIFTFKNGNIYSGEFNTDFEPDGYGIMTYSDKDTFEGLFEKGRMKKGLYTGKNLIYDGSFDSTGHFYGKGILTKTDGGNIKKIDANFVNNDDGDGEIYYKDGSLYDGKFTNNEKNGSGTLIVEGSKSVGNYVKGVKEGAFVLYPKSDDDTERMECNFNNDVIDGLVNYYHNGTMTKLVFKNGVADKQASIKLNTSNDSPKQNNNFKFGIYKVNPSISNYSSMYIMFNQKHTVVTFLGSDPSDIQDSSKWKSGGTFIFDGNKIKMTITTPQRTNTEWEIMSDGTLRNGDLYLTFSSNN